MSFAGLVSMFSSTSFLNVGMSLDESSMSFTVVPRDLSSITMSTGLCSVGNSTRKIPFFERETTVLALNPGAVEKTLLADSAPLFSVIILFCARSSRPMRTRSVPFITKYPPGSSGSFE